MDLERLDAISRLTHDELWLTIRTMTHADILDLREVLTDRCEHIDLQLEDSSREWPNGMPMTTEEFIHWRRSARAARSCVRSGLRLCQLELSRAQERDSARKLEEKRLEMLRRLGGTVGLLQEVYRVFRELVRDSEMDADQKEVMAVAHRTILNAKRAVTQGAA